MNNAKFIKKASEEINIVPLLDVLLILVVVLMLMVPYMAKAMHVNLPSASAATAISQDSSVALEIHADGSVWFAGAQVSDWSQISTEIQGATAAKVYADKRAAFAAITVVLDQLAANDIHNIQFGTKN